MLGLIVAEYRSLRSTMLTKMSQVLDCNAEEGSAYSLLFNKNVNYKQKTLI